jgi:hypothetical protein
MEGNLIMQQQPKKSHRRLWIVLAIIGGVLVLSCTICGVVAAFAPQTQTAVQPTQAAATATVAPTATHMLIRPTAKPTKTGGPIVQTITHGKPHLRGPVSDFYGKYGTDIGPNGVQDSDGTSSVGWFISTNDANGGDVILVHYSDSSRLVNYISYNGPSSWSKAQYRDYLIANFAPAGTATDNAANSWWASTGGDRFDPIAYTSDSGKFFLHISDGNGWMNTA